jgi:hypothetical protein
MFKSLPLGLKCMTVVEALVAFLFALVVVAIVGADAYVVITGRVPADKLGALVPSLVISLGIGGAFCFGFVVSVRDNLALKKAAVLNHYVVAALYLLFDGQLWSCLAGGLGPQTAHRGYSSFSQNGADIFLSEVAILAVLAFAVWNVLYFRREKIKGILVN